MMARGGCWAGWRGSLRDSCRAPVAAQADRVGGQVGDVGVGEVGGLNAAGDAGFGQQPADAPGEGIDLGGGVALVGPALAEYGVAAAIGGAPECPPVGEQVPQARVDYLVGG